MSMIDKKFKNNLVIGEFDCGFDFKKDQTEIDVKNYATKICKNDQEILKCNLLIDKKQYNNHQADIYIQSFILIDDSNKPYIVIAGYATKNMLTLNSRFQKPAYCCSVSQLLTYDDLKKQYF
jgi:hypothetical protein